MDERDPALHWSGEKLFRVGFFVELALVLLAALLGFALKGSAFPFPIRLDAHGLLWGLAASVPAALLALAFTSETGRRIPGIGRIHDRVKDILDRPLRELGAAEILLLSAAAGVGEEVLFRGVLQGVAGIWIPSIVFGLLHALTPTYFILATGIGVYLGYLQAGTGNLLAPILVHSIYDAVALYLLRREFRREAEEEGATEEGGTAKATTAAVIGVCVLALAVPMSDVFITSIRRILKRQSPMIGGLDNIHYVLLKRGWPEKTVVLVFYLITALLSAGAVTFILLRMKQ